MKKCKVCECHFISSEPAKYCLKCANEIIKLMGSLGVVSFHYIRLIEQTVYNQNNE